MPYFPGPEMVLRGMIDDRQVLLDSTFESLQAALSGYAAGVAAGLVSGVLMGWSRRAAVLGDADLEDGRADPCDRFRSAGDGDVRQAVLLRHGLDRRGGLVPRDDAHDLGDRQRAAVVFRRRPDSRGAGGGYLVFRVAIPAAMPSIFIGLFMGFCTAFLTLIVAETLGVSSGLGWYLKWQQGYLEYAKVYAALVIMAFFFSGSDDVVVQSPRSSARLAARSDPVVTMASIPTDRTADEASALSIRGVRQDVSHRQTAPISPRWPVCRCRSRPARWCR